MNAETVQSSASDVIQSIKGYVNVEELVKSVFAGLGTGAGVFSTLALINTNLTNIITDPTLLTEVQNLVKYGTARNWIAFTFGVLALVATLYQKFNAGVLPTPTPVPTPAK